MNKAILMGRLTRDPEVRETGTGTKIAKYTLAVDRRGRQQEGEQTADFLNVTAFNKAGEFAEKYFRQGMRVLVTGRIQTGSYTNKDGQKVYTTDIIAEDQEFADSKNSGNTSGGYSNSTFPAMGDGFMDIPQSVEDEGLPF